MTGVQTCALPILRFSQRFFVKQQQQLGQVNGIVEEDFAGQSVIAVFNQGERATQQFNQVNDQLCESAWKSQFLSGLMQPLMTFIGNMAYAMVVVVGAQLAISNVITIGDIQAFMQYVRNFTQPIQQLASISNVFQQMAAAAERVFEFLDAPVESEPQNSQLPAVRQGAVSFDNVSFGYLPGHTVIHDFSCQVKPGQTVAIVGPTGAGKTTIMKLMMRFYDVDEGSLAVDGLDVRSWNQIGRAHV